MCTLHICFYASAGVLIKLYCVLENIRDNRNANIDNDILTFSFNGLEMA